MNELEKIAFIEYSARCLGEFLAREKVAVKKTKLVRSNMKCANAIPPPVAAAGGGILKRLGAAAPHLNEVAGLGVLGVPSAMSLAGKPMDEHNAHLFELGGLGMLAAPYAYHSARALAGRPTPMH